jgi:MFS family permease
VGLRAVVRDPILRALAGCHLTVSFSFGMIGAVILLFTTRTLGLAPGLQGAIFAVGGITSLLGAAFAGRLTRRGGFGPTLIVSLAVTAIGMLFIPLARGPALFAVACLVANQIVTDFAEEIYSIDSVSLRQAVAPERLQGRVNATSGFLAQGALLLGSLAGGLLGQAVGLRPVFVVAAGGTLLAVLWLLPRPVRGLREPPEPSLSLAEPGPS